MSDIQLREAHSLMKAGDKQGASRIVQEVLRQDRSNVNAWWLFSMLLEDEERVVKSLEKILAINPEHPGARKKLASLRPEYVHLAEIPALLKEKAKSDVSLKEKTRPSGNDYWRNLENKRIQAKTAKPANDDWARLWGNTSGPVKALAIVGPILLVIVVIFLAIQIELSVYDTKGQRPEDVVVDFYDALYREDVEALYNITCPERYSRIDMLVSRFSGLNPEDVTVDLSRTRLKLYDQTDDLAYIQIFGIMTGAYGGTSYTIDWLKDAHTEGYDGYGVFLERIEGVWLVCNPYYIATIEYEDN